MSQKKIIAIFGATGAQGGGLARAILQDKNSDFSVRAITRDVDSENAKTLKQMGADVVSADVDDAESVKKAMKGTYGAYCVTFYWAHLKPDKEIAEAKIMAEAAKENDLKHVIWSTLEDTRKWVPLSDDRMPTLMGKYKVPHFDAKGEADHFFTDAGVPTTFLRPSFYWENMIYFGMGPKKGADGALQLTLPMGDKKLSGIAGEDIGKCAYGIFKMGPSLAGKTIGVAGDELTGEQMAAALTKALGQEVKYLPVTPATFRSFGFPGADDLGNMFQFYQEFEDLCTSVRNVRYSKELNPAIQSFDEWLQNNAKKIPLE